MLNQNAFNLALQSPAIKAMNDADAATTLSIPIYNDIAVADLAQMVDTRGLRPRIALAQTNADPNIAGAAVTALGVISAPYKTVKLSNPSILALFQGVMTALLNAGVGFTADDAAAILSLSITYPCGQVIQTSDVTAARAQMVLSAQGANLQQWLMNGFMAGQRAIALAVNSGSALPTQTYLQSLFALGSGE